MNTSRDARVGGHIKIIFGKYRNIMYLVSVAYYEGMLFL